MPTRASLAAEHLEGIVPYLDRITTGNVSHNVAGIKAAIYSIIRQLREPAPRKRSRR